MQLKKLSPKILSIIIPLGLILALIILIYFIPKNSISTSSTPIIQPAQINVSLPIRLKIPSINISADIESVSITAGGAMDTPKNPANVAWYNLGPRPGEIGNAVLAGHSGQWKNGQGSVFDQLHQLKITDKIYIEDSQGITTSFSVTEFRNYDPEADASTVFNSTNGKSHLNLVTCEGIWNKTTKSYSERFVVFTDKISD